MMFGSPKTSYFRLMSFHGVLETVTCLLTCPDTSDVEQIVSSIHSLLSVWMMDEDGLFFLANRPEQTNAIVRTLLGIKTDEENEDNRKDAADDEEGMKN